MLRSLAVRSFVEPYFPLTRLKHRIKFKEPKIRLVAVAKNEGRYLTEWILHHLYFGVEHIEVHYNQCDDNTIALGEYLSSKYPVTFINADKCFAPHLKSPQVGVYRSSLKRAADDGFSHILFLDIDEFFVPKDLAQTYNTLASDKRYYDVISANWCNKLQDTTQFGLALEKTISIEVSPTVKSLLKTFITPSLMNPHNVISSKLRYGMSGNANFVTDRDDKSKVTKHISRFEDADFFVLHRQYRSQLEYVAMLGRGRPIELSKQRSVFKNNRRGYNIYTNKASIQFPEDSFKEYSNFLEKHMNVHEILEFHHNAEEMVIERYKKVIEMIASAPRAEHSLLMRLLKNVELQEVKDAFQSANSISTFK